VNVAELPRTGQTVKVLGVQVAAADPSQPPLVIRPTAETIRDETYPYAEQLWLYVVPPQASDVAKNFTDFIATCGGSEASPGTDPVRPVMKAYQEHGWLPLADAAIQREADDARAEAAAKALPPKPVKASRK